MSQDDLIIKNQMEMLVASKSSSQTFIAYFESLPPKRIRRSLALLSQVYLSNYEFDFIYYLFSNDKYLEALSFPQIVSFVSTIDFKTPQKSRLAVLIKEKWTLLSEVCTFELDNLLVRIVSPVEIMIFIEKTLEEGTSKAVLQHFFDLLTYEQVLSEEFSANRLNQLKKKVTLAMT